MAFLSFSTTGNIYSQFVPKAVQSSNTVIQGLTDRVESHGWLYFKDVTELDPDSYFITYGTDMGLGANDEMVKIDEWEGEGQTHFRYQQYHKSIPVKYGEYIIHAVDCEAIIAHGKLVENLNISTLTTVSEATALQNALNDIGATTYAWQDTDWEYQAQEDMDDPNATWYPEGELEIYGEPDVDMTASNFNLAYRFEILSIDPYASRIVYIDAHNGYILSNEDAHQHATGTCTTLYYGSRTIETNHRGWPNNDYILEDHSRGDKIWTKKWNSIADPWWAISNITDDNNAWGTPNSASTTAHWVAEMAWDYFLNEWNWEGCNGKGQQLRLLTERTLTMTSYRKGLNKDYIDVGLTGGMDDATLDIIGHEFTHGVAHHKAKMHSNNSEAGALCESFCYIFGEAIERNVLGSNDWLFGADTGTPTRDLATPTNFGDPNTYMQSGFWDTANEPHTNAGVQNKWFNLLTVGGTQNGITVVGIGFDKAIRITKGNLFNNMTSGSNYAAARSGAIAVATAIWGACSNETIQTTNAWAACGVGGVFSGLCPFNIIGTASICANYPSGTWTVDVVSGQTVTWSYPSWWNVTISGDGDRKLTLNSFSATPPISTSVVISATSSTGGSDTHYIWVNAECFSPPCDGLESFLIGSNPNTVSPINSDKDMLKVFPNPTTGKFTVRNKLLKDNYNIKIINTLGNTVMEREASGAIFELDIETLSKGVYYVKIDHPNYQGTSTIIKL